jgi:hypothetical protein
MGLRIFNVLTYNLMRASDLRKPVRTGEASLFILQVNDSLQHCNISFLLFESEDASLLRVRINIGLFFHSVLDILDIVRVCLRTFCLEVRSQTLVCQSSSIYLANSKIKQLTIPRLYCWLIFISPQHLQSPISPKALLISTLALPPTMGPKHAHIPASTLPPADHYLTSLYSVHTQPVHFISSRICILQASNTHYTTAFCKPPSGTRVTRKVFQRAP